VLGPVNHRVTVFLPGAEGVRVLVSDGRIVELNRMHDEGLFSGPVAASGGLAYRLDVRYPLATVTLEDPYRFPSLLGADDRYLFNNGTHEQAYRFMGANHRRVD